MGEIMLRKVGPNTLATADAEADAALAKVKLGGGVRAKVSAVRNIDFHRKAFKLFQFAFEHWEPTTPLEHKGLPVAKEFEAFRKDITILAGFYRAVYDINGEMRLEAESLSFSAMTNERFELVYRGVLSVVWDRIFRFKQYADEDAVDRIVDELLRYE